MLSCLFWSLFTWWSLIFSITEYRSEEETWDVLLLSFKNDRAVFACLCLAAHEIEELFEADQIIVVRLGLRGHSDSFPTCRPTAAVRHALICIVVLSLISCLNFYQLVRIIQVLLCPSIDLVLVADHLLLATILLIISLCRWWILLWTTCRCHTNLHNFFICQKGKRSQLSCWDCLGWVGRWLRTSTDVNGTFGWNLLVRSQF